ncbi:DUF2235 domain-containing protein [Acinetobacter haemolyticus]|uniref:DUF2235 domain-containing protein n=1 Tax=Acinetobacter haemolyticus TaxID=29430 RepID=UPI0012985E6A|nr:DUF2235 domain-containing protein [Acinetobacter haemolyticus]MQZ30310.1 DUF2235 domain-containing protein [Acinetobacter haemolyticus]
MKRIIICIDGTWNKPNGEDTREDTNVCKISKLIINDGINQKVEYLKGVGTSKYPWVNWFEGYSGTGTTEKILKSYEWLINNFDLGDEIFLFGFSRGAFAVRSLGGLIRQVGILKKEYATKSGDEFNPKIKEAYDMYRNRGKKNHPDSENAKNFRKKFSQEDETKIKFIGVWDTVGSLGNPLLPNFMISSYSKFHDTTLSSIVEHANHAIAICERRWLFQPCLWERSTNSKDGNKVFNQCWFIGAHANIGGGYVEEGLSNRTLKWMIDKAKDAGLKFDDAKVDKIDIHSGLMVRDETYKALHYKIKASDRIIGEKDHDVTVYRNEFLHDDVIPMIKGVIKLKWLDEKYKPKGLFEYLKKKGINIS